MMQVFRILMLAAVVSSCHFQAARKSAPSELFEDSLAVEITALNLSEDLTGNDEVLIFCYRYRDSTTLDESLFWKRFTLHSKNNSKQFKVRINPQNEESPLLFFLLEQDADLPPRKIDSTLRISHAAIRKQFTARNYTGIETYLGDEDILGIRLIPVFSCEDGYVTNFAGIYKLDKFNYQLSITCVSRSHP